MRNFDFYSPTYFVFGKDREAETGRYVKRFGGSRVLVVYGGQSAKRSGRCSALRRRRRSRAPAVRRSRT